MALKLDAPSTKLAPPDGVLWHATMQLNRLYEVENALAGLAEKLFGPTPSESREDEPTPYGEVDALQHAVRLNGSRIGACLKIIESIKSNL